MRPFSVDLDPRLPPGALQILKEVNLFSSCFASGWAFAFWVGWHVARQGLDALAQIERHRSFRRRRRRLPAN